MLIDYLTERYIFSQSNLALSVILYLLAGAVALILHRWGQVRCRKKHATCESGLWKTLLKDLPSELWQIAFFLLTGCLRSSLWKEHKTENKGLNRKIFFWGIQYNAYGLAGSFLLPLLFQLLQAIFGGSIWSILLLSTKALVGANLSLLWFSILPLPDSDAERLLRTKPLTTKEANFRKGGTFSFFLFCVVGLLLACIAIPLPNGTLCSLSGILSLFPVLLIGG